ncbi:MAG: alcohol dehydrogenase catalytic domain-containing protein [Clostridia bacterium]|nr:alcohol dehydrogenase catalytic domain-containing protein [Clostridia bacterium]
MKSVRILRPGVVRLTEEEIPVPKQGEALIRMRRVGICGTDHNIFRGEFSERVNFPLRPGHEWSGEIAALGENAAGYSVGDCVTGEAMVACGKCPDCIRGDKYACRFRRSVGTVNAWDGAMCEYFVFPVRDLLPLGGNTDLDAAAMVEPASNALMGVEGAGIRVGSTVAVMGTGPIGLAAVAIARIYGAATVISVGRSEYKLEIARGLGATHTVNTKNEDAAERILEITGGLGVDASLEISGAETLFRAAIKSTRKQGSIVLIGFHDHPITLNLNDLIFPLFTIKGAGGGWGGYAPKVLRLMDRGVLNLDVLITQRCTLDEAPGWIENLKTDSARTVKVMICG